MATMAPERTRTDEQPTTVVERRRTGFVVVAIVMAALLGFGLGWAMFRDTGTDVPADVQELIDAYAEAWNETDGEAAVALMTPGARFYASMMVPDEGYAGDDLVAHINGLRGDAITTGSTTVIGDDPYLVVSENRVGGYDGTSAFFVVSSGDELLISGHHWYRN